MCTHKTLYKIYFKWFQSHWHNMPIAEDIGDLVDFLDNVLEGQQATIPAIPPLDSLPGGLSLLRVCDLRNLMLRRSFEDSIPDFDRWDPGASLLHLAAGSASTEYGDQDDDSSTSSQSEDSLITFLYGAVHTGYCEDESNATDEANLIAQLAQDCEIPLDITDECGETPLHYACKGTALSVVKELLCLARRYNVSVDTPNNLNETPLHAAVGSGEQYAFVCALLHCGVNVNFKNKVRSTQNSLLLYVLYCQHYTQYNLSLLSSLTHAGW
eukprot:gb/GECG01010106.1/.p1 GENE.gb/GECG01010106.1/~~gb/GECG01010106.1/.p1  ORF type:complete len:269 (+),score=23.71 gb/GECG01010106.1/:1-807(+)